MDLQGERTIPADIHTTWAALNDPEVLRQCILGCESLDATGTDAYVAQMTVRIGPVSAKFKGNIKLSDIQAPHSYKLSFDGQGGVAGHGKGTADVRLSALDAKRTVLSYQAQAQVGGKIAQVGSRLVDAAAAKIADDFFAKFEAVVQDQTRGDGVAPSASGDTPKATANGRPAWIWIAAAVAAAALLYVLAR